MDDFTLRYCLPRIQDRVRAVANDYPELGLELVRSDQGTWRVMTKHPNANGYPVYWGWHADDALDDMLIRIQNNELRGFAAWEACKLSSATPL